MNIDKSQVRISVAHDIGVRMDDVLEGAKADVARADGATSIAVKISSDIEGLFAHVQKDIDAGGMDLEQGKLVMSWLVRAKNVAASHATQAAQGKFIAQGRVMAGEAAVKLVLGIKTEEETKVRVFSAAVAAGRVKAEDAGRPPPAIKAQRQAEEGTLTEDADEGSPAKAEEAVVEEAVEDTPPPKATKRKR